MWKRHCGYFDVEAHCDDGDKVGEGGIDDIGSDLIRSHFGKRAVLVGASTTFFLALFVVYVCVFANDGNFRLYSALSWANGYISHHFGVVLLVVLALLASCVAFASAWSTWSETMQLNRHLICAAMILGILILKMSVALLIARVWSREHVIQSANAICLNAASYQRSWGCVEQSYQNTSNFDVVTDAKAQARRLTSQHEVAAIFLEEIPKSSRCSTIQNFCAPSPADFDPAFACVCSQAQTTVASTMPLNTTAPETIALFNWPGIHQLPNTKETFSASPATSKLTTTATVTKTMTPYQWPDLFKDEDLFLDDDTGDDDDDDTSVRRTRVSTSRISTSVGTELSTTSSNSTLSTPATATVTQAIRCQSNADCPALHTCVARPVGDFTQYVQTCEQVSDASDESTSTNTITTTTTTVLCTSNADCAPLGGTCLSVCASMSTNGCAGYVQVCRQLRRLQASADHTYCSDWDGPGTSQWCTVSPGCSCGASLVDGLWRSSGPCTDSVDSVSASLLASMAALDRVFMWSAVLSMSLFVTAGCGRWIFTAGLTR